MLSFAGLLSSKEDFTAPKRSTGSVYKRGHHHKWGVTGLGQDRSSNPRALQPLRAQHCVLMYKICKHHDLCLPAQSHRSLRTTHTKIAHAVQFCFSSYIPFPRPCQLHASHVSFPTQQGFSKLQVNQRRVPNFKESLPEKLVFFLEASRYTHAFGA